LRPCMTNISCTIILVTMANPFEKEKKPTRETQKVTSWEKCTAIAKGLIETYGGNRLPRGRYGRPAPEVPETASDVFSTLPSEKLQHFYAHGVTRGLEDTDILASVISILENSAVVGDFGPLSEKGVGAPYTNAPYIVIARETNFLCFKIDGKGKPIQMGIEYVGGQKANALEVDIAALVVNAQHPGLVDALKKRYPNANIVDAVGLKKFLEGGS